MTTDPKAEPKYTLTLTSAQARTVIHALDLYSRVGMRQFDSIGSVLTFELRRDGEESVDAIQAARQAFTAAKKALGFEPGSSLSIRGAPRLARIAYDIQQVLRQRVANQESPGGHSVWHDDPLPTDDHPLATCTVEGT